MKISGRRDYIVSLESVAMTDIVLNMFIFFFISFSLLYTFSPNRIQKLYVKLPQATNVAPIKDKIEVSITMTNEGFIYLDKKVVTKKQLKDNLYVLHKENPAIKIILMADRLVHFKDVVKVLDTLTELGITNLNIAAVTK